MINVDSKLTVENEHLKGFILENYEHDSISVSYGCFYTPLGWFDLGQKRHVEPAEYCFVFSKHGSIQTLSTHDYKDIDFLNSCMKMAEIEPRKQKIETKNADLPKYEPKNEPKDLFDFL